jgi:type II secretory pathway component PulC
VARGGPAPHNSRMRSSLLNVTVSAATAATLLLGTTSPLMAAEGEQRASIVVRAAGKQGTVSRTKRAGRAEPEALPASIDGGEIPRAALQAELAKGIGRFLQQVRVEPVVSRGRFMGWRLATLFANRADVKVQGLRPGDIVLRANGQAIERPEELVVLWGTLATADQIVLEIQRGNETTTVRYAIK